MTAWRCEGCGNEVIGKIRRGRCDPCYRKLLKALRAAGTDKLDAPRKYRSARRPARRLPVTERIFQRTTPGWGGCVIFTGPLNGDNYGRIKIAGQMLNAHRQLYLDAVGPVPDGMMLDHTCHSSDAECPGGKECLHRRCVNPNHLEPVTAAENNMRGRSLTAQNFLKTHCDQGHEFTPENTKPVKRLRIDGTPQRHCRTCAREATQRWRRRTRKRR